MYPFTHWKPNQRVVLKFNSKQRQHKNQRIQSIITDYNINQEESWTSYKTSESSAI